MSDINYDIYGQPETWSEWSDSPTSQALYGNIRIGAANFSDADFTDYPSFKVMGTYKSLRELYTAGLQNINEPIDNSLAYSAFANPALPQMNVGCFGKGHTSKSDPLMYRDNSSPIPFSFAYWNDFNTAGLNPCSYQQIFGVDGFPDDASVIGQQKLQRWSPYAACQSTNITSYKDFNPSGYIVPLLSFGIKSVFYEIEIVYVDNGSTAALSNLETYLSHTESWLQQHKCVGAYLRPYYRTNKNGTYTYTVPTGTSVKDRVNGIQPVYHTPFILGNTKIYNYTGNWVRNGGCLPVYGNCITDSFYAYTYITSFKYDTPSKSNDSYYAMIYGYDRGDLHVNVSGDGAEVYTELDLSVADNVEYIMRGAAAYGLFFCKAIGTLNQAGRDSGSTERWLDDKMYLGIIAADGCTYGDYTHGADNADQQQYGWKSSTETPYVPGSGSDPNSYSNQTKFNIISPTVQMTKQYVLNAVNVAKLASDLWSITATLSSSQTDFTDFEGKVKDEFLTNDPLECIVSLRRFPFDIEHEASSVNVKLGKTAGSAVGYQNKYSSAEFSFRPVDIFPRFGNSFLDYAPYTEYELYVPFCGVTKIDAADILGHTLNVKMIADLTTGSCTAFIMADDLVIQSLSGSVAVEIPVTGTDAATINSQIMNGILNNERAQNQAKTALASIFTPSGFVKNIASFGMSSAKENIAAAENVKKADYDLTHINAPVHTIGSASALEKWYIDLQCRLLIYYPEGDAVTSAIPPDLNSDVIARYGATTGFSTVEEGKIEDYAGLTVAVNPVLSNIVTGTLSVPASSRELEMIEEALSEGVIVPVKQ